MLFNSFEFFIFFPIVTALYFLLPHRFRVYLLLASSCYFYMAFIPKYIFILFLTILVDYTAGIILSESKNPKIRKAALWGSIVLTCAILFVFKYYNFFNESAEGIARFLGLSYAAPAIKLILPIGLSFHTFQSLSYVIEVFRGNQKPERNFWYYALYVMFYPQLVAGPIERPQNLLHQFREVHFFEYRRVTNGLKLMAWGLFKKVVIADSLGILVDTVYSSPRGYEGIPLIVATIFFAIQIYCDFSGYSNIAIGSAQVMGFNLMTNFDKPYFSKSIGEFWRRWHISLSTWFKDYVYVPLGGNRTGEVRIAVNLMITFLVSGLWHGANWTFIIWGGLNGLYIVVGRQMRILSAKIEKKLGPVPGWLKPPGFVQVASTFFLINITWIFFRIKNVQDGLWVCQNLTSGLSKALARAANEGWSFISSGTFMGYNMGFDNNKFTETIFLILMLFVIEQYENPKVLRELFSARSVWVRWPAYLLGTYTVLYFMLSKKSQFIYFQF
ncbi:MAG: MBOAT family protein [Oligoflexales bacterium]|nr:MBOAT family protein [Oligoflexales bacterium]